MALIYTDENPDISYETTYDLPGDMFGIEMAHKIKCHTQHGKTFIDYLLNAHKVGGKHYGITLDPSYYIIEQGGHFPTIRTPQHLHFMLQIASGWSNDFGDLRIYEYTTIGKRSKYQDALQKHLGFRTYPDIEKPSSD